MKNTAKNPENKASTNTLNSNILRNLQGALKEKKIKQKDLASRMGISPAAFSALMSGKNKMSLPQLTRIIELTGIEFSQVYQKAYESSAQRYNISEDDEKKLYKHKHAFLAWCVLASPKTRDELCSYTRWSEQIIDSSLELLDELKMIKISLNGSISQSLTGNVKFMWNPKLRKEREELFSWHMSHTIVEEMEKMKAEGIDPNTEPLKLKFNYNTIFFLKAIQIEEIYKDIYTLILKVESMIRENNLHGYSSSEKDMRLTQIKLVIFDYFNKQWNPR